MHSNVRRILTIGLVLGMAQSLSISARAASSSFAATTPQAYGSGTACTAPLTGTINVPDSFNITDLNVRFIASHSWRTDTNLSLTSPNNTTVDLLTGPYQANLNNYNVTFDDAAGTVVDTGAHAVNQSVTGAGMSVRSESDPLSDFNGEDAQGDWTYSLCDVYTAADSGSMTNLTLIFEIQDLPDLAAEKTIEAYQPGGYFLPNADVIYAISVTNSGAGSVDSDTMFLVDTIPATLTFYNGDMDDAGTATTDPVAFSETGSGLTFTYTTDAGYSDVAAAPTSMADCTFTPAPGYDSDVKHICFNPKGAFQAGDPDPTFTVSFRAKVK